MYERIIILLFSSPFLNKLISFGQQDEYTEQKPPSPIFLLSITL